MTHLNIGDNAPHFNGNIEDGSTVSSSSLKGQKYILFFYPKDDTPGCTREACNLRDNFRWFEKNGFQIFGVSPDNEKKHQKFIDKYEFQYSLIADTDKEMINSFGIWGPKKFMGREFDGVHRTTFVINEDGKITEIIKKVKTKEHAEQLIEALK
jgi:peroxiredoxin Q/BCP